MFANLQNATETWTSSTNTFSWKNTGNNFIATGLPKGDISSYTNFHCIVSDFSENANFIRLVVKNDKDPQITEYINAGEFNINLVSKYPSWDFTCVTDILIFGSNSATEGHTIDADHPASVVITDVYMETPPSTTITIENPANLVEIPLEQDQEPGGTFTLADYETANGITTYTAKDGISFCFKMCDVDVENCDYIIFMFAEALSISGLRYSFWNGQDLAEFPQDGITYFKYIFADDDDCAIVNNVIPQVTLFTWFGNFGKEVKVKGVYKHLDLEFSRTYSFDQALDFTDTGLEAYVITSFDADKGTLTLSRVYQVPANTGLYLVGKDGDYEIPTIDSADPIATNLLKHSGDGTITKISGDYTNLVLAGSGDNRGFHPLSGDGNMGENKAYLQLSTTDYNSIAGARLKMVFEDEATAIKTVKVAEVETGIFNLAGQRLAKAQKGLNIINGKKVLVK